jgi:hypothetical protein
VNRVSAWLVAGAFVIGVLVGMPKPPVEASAFSAPLWSVVSGGGGLATGTNFVVESAIQPIAGPTEGANFRINAGFLQAFDDFLAKYVPSVFKNAAGS